MPRAAIEDVDSEQQLVNLASRAGVELAKHHGGMTQHLGELRAGLRPDRAYLGNASDGR
jgi:hypothetical protein